MSTIKKLCRIRELEQEEIASSEIIDVLEKKTAVLGDQLSDSYHTINELKQEKVILNAEIEHVQKARQNQLKKYLVIFIAMSIALASIMIVYLYEGQNIIKPGLMHDYKSQYVIQNLKGDTIDTWTAWDIPNDRVLRIQINNKADLANDKIDAVRNAILSQEQLEIDDSMLHKGPKGYTSVYYVGWLGALTDIKSSANIPTKFEISETFDGAADIVITLESLRSPDGYSGWTESLVDNNQILKSSITIYQANEISADQLSIIIRHEFGHALGLAHATAPEDIMAPTIQTFYPYISECDIKAVKMLYEEKHTSQVVCEK